MDSPARSDLAAPVAACRRSDALASALHELYAQADRVLGEQGLRCLGGGACCRFDLAGHRLYVSSGELSLLLSAPPADPARARRLRCPWQSGPRCVARSVRPLGCRTFFCDAGAAGPRRKLHERLHAEIRRLHDTLGLPYLYGDLTEWIVQLEGDEASGADERRQGSFLR